MNGIDPCNKAVATFYFVEAIDGFFTQSHLHF